MKFADAQRGKLGDTLYLKLVPGDVVYVPQAKDGKSGLSNIIAGLGALNIFRSF